MVAGEARSADQPVLRAAATGVALAALVLVLYWPATGGEFVSLDDPRYVFANEHVLGGLSWDAVGWAFGTVHASNWHPLTWLSLQLDATLWGGGPFGFLAVNVVLHALNTLLLFVALWRMTGALTASALVAALFAVHPLRVESVAWVSERKDVLSGTGWMATLLAYDWYARRPGRGRYALVAAALTLGLLAKPMLVTLPVVLLLLDWWPLRRLSAADPAARRRLASLLLEKLPLLAIAAAVAAATVVAQRSGGAVASLAQVPLALRLLNALAAYGAYLWKTVWPLDLAVFYPHAGYLPGDPLAALRWPALGGAALLLGVSALVLAAARRRPYLAVGWLWYVLTLLPVIGLVHVGQQAMADRYTYVPLIGIAIMLVFLARDAVRQWPRLRPLGLALAVVVLSAGALQTRRQIAVWQNSLTLFEHALAVTADNYFAHTNLAAVLVALRRDDDAVPHYEAALRIAPRYATALTGLASVLSRRGRIDDAAALNQRALAEEPDSPVMLSNQGAVRLQQDRLAEAQALFERALLGAPDYAIAHANLGVIAFRRGEVGRAADHFRRAATLNPVSVAAHMNLGLAMLQLGRPAEAAVAFETVLRLHPGNPDATRHLATARAAGAPASLAGEQ